MRPDLAATMPLPRPGDGTPEEAALAADAAQPARPEVFLGTSRFAVAARDPEAARSAMRAHLDHVTTDLARWSGALDGDERPALDGFVERHHRVENVVAEAAVEQRRATLATGAGELEHAGSSTCRGALLGQHGPLVVGG